MYILIKNVIICISYLLLLGYVYIGNFTLGYMDRILILFTLYYVLLMIPKIHHIYIYNLVERMIPKWTYFIRAVFHYTLFYPELTKSFPSVISIVLIMIWKDIIFLINHAERRITKIETSLYEEELGYRIAHLHLNLFTDDTCNRFHKHCFDTNRIHLIENTHASNESLLSIHNYRKLRREKKIPRQFTGDDKIHYEASNNKTIFISQRWSFLCTPLLTIIWMFAMTDLSGSFVMYINHLLILFDIATSYFGNKVNDICIDVSYLVAFIFIVLKYTPQTQ